MSRDREFQNGGSFVFVSTNVKGADLSVVFKVGQVRALEAVYLGKDLLTELPIGYGKSLIFQLILVKAITFVWLCAEGVPCKLVLHFFLYFKNLSIGKLDNQPFRVSGQKRH